MAKAACPGPVNPVRLGRQVVDGNGMNLVGGKTPNQTQFGWQKQITKGGNDMVIGEAGKIEPGKNGNMIVLLVVANTVSNGVRSRNTVLHKQIALVMEPPIGKTNRFTTVI